MKNVSRETMDKNLSIYIELLLKWQQKINLISAHTIPDIKTRHIQDSLQLLKFLDGCKTLIDIGTGAGLPGIPLSLASGIKTYLIESDLRKTIFLDEVIRHLHLNAVTINQRIENAVLPKIIEPVVITARALGAVEKLLELLHSFLENNNITSYKILLLKGKNVSRETFEAAKHWEFNAVYERSETDSDSSIVIIDKFKRKVI